MKIESQEDFPTVTEISPEEPSVHLTWQTTSSQWTVPTPSSRLVHPSPSPHHDLFSPAEQGRKPIQFHSFIQSVSFQIRTDTRRYERKAKPRTLICKARKRKEAKERRNNDPTRLLHLHGVSTPSISLSRGLQRRLVSEGQRGFLGGRGSDDTIFFSPFSTLYIFEVCI